MLRALTCLISVNPRELSTYLRMECNYFTCIVELVLPPPGLLWSSTATSPTDTQSTGPWLVTVGDISSPILEKTKKAVQQAAHNIVMLKSVAHPVHKAFSCLSMSGVIGRRSLLADCGLKPWIPLWTNTSFGIGSALGSGKSHEICKYLMVAK